VSNKGIEYRIADKQTKRAILGVNETLNATHIINFSTEYLNYKG